jgi:hypothetical protein
MKMLICTATLTRHDLLNANFVEIAANLQRGDGLLVLDNGTCQPITLAGPGVEVVRSPVNLGVARSWNYFLRRAFVEGGYDAAMILGDDVRAGSRQVRRAKELLGRNADVDLLLSFSFFDVQVHRRSNIETVGYFDERYSPAWCEDDDYALTMTQRGRVYQRFRELGPLPGSQRSGTTKLAEWRDARRKFRAKWPEDAGFGVNAPGQPHFATNRARRAGAEYFRSGRFRSPIRR